MTDKYIPGQCNIGKYESEKRLKFGVFGLILTCGFSFLFFVFAVDKAIVFILLFTSAFTASLGFLQYKNKFCVYYSFLNVYNFENITKLLKVKDVTDAEKDKQKALMLTLYTTVIAFVYTVIFVLITR